MSYHTLLVIVLSLAANALGAVVKYNWDITWVLANPDGELVRPVIGVNNHWPPPLINVTIGDRLEVTVNNRLGNETTGIHWHGIFQTGSTAMDGPRGITGCPIPPGGSFTYNFTVNQPGDYWYHSHDIAQYPDGIRGPLIVTDPSNPYAGQYDDELVITVSDWYHDQMPGLMAFYLSIDTDPTGNEPEPYSALINDQQNTRISVQSGLTYLVRLINIGAFSQFWVQIDQHNLTIIEVDGNFVNPVEVNKVFITVGQRYGLLMKTKPTASRNYAILGSMDEAMYDEIPAYLNPNVTGYLIYDENAPLPPDTVITDFDLFDDFSLVPTDREPVFGPPAQTVILDLNFTTEFNQNRAVFNNITYLEQKVPTLLTAMSAGEDAVYPEIYGVNTNTYVLEYGTVIQLVINNYDTGPHPIHTHGHAPQHLSRVSSGYYTPGEAVESPPSPMRRDVWLVYPGGHTVSRFIANNPGVWFLHCHMEWHLLGGLAITFVEAPLELQASQTIPASAYALCEAQGTPTAGNAAGNTKNYFDLQGAVTTPNPSPSGALVS